MFLYERSCKISIINTMARWCWPLAALRGSAISASVLGVVYEGAMACNGYTGSRNFWFTLCVRMIYPGPLEPDSS